MNHKQRFLTTIGVTAGLVAGGGAGLILQSTGSAGAAGAVVAATSTPSTTTATTDANPTDGTVTGSATPSARTARAGAKLQKVLQSLIDDGTLTQAQVDAVIAKVEAARPADGGRDHGRRGGRGMKGDAGVLRAEFDKVATLLGVTPAEMRTALTDGTSLKAYAESKGKTGQDVIDVLVADTKAHLDTRVANGKLTQTEADTKLASATTKITDLVDNGRPARPHDAPVTDEPATDAPAATATTTG